MLRLFPKPEVRPRTTARWGWMLLSLSSLAVAGYFLYPALENFSEHETAPPAPASAPSPPIPQKPAPPPQAASTPPQAASTPPQAASTPPQAASIEVIGKTMTPAKPIRTPAPVAVEGVRNRIIGEIPIEVTIQIGKDGSVVNAQSTSKGDGVQSYLVQRALEAVRQWRFRPAMADQDPIPAEWIVRFRFRRSGVEWN
jgi:periplasmic protein TonB